MATYSGSVTLSSTHTIPEGATENFDPDVTTTVTVSNASNFIVLGKLEMKPSSNDVVHTLRFTGINEATMVGGGMDVLSTDPGLWVTDDGELDLVGTPRVGWNRTGDDPTWLSTDEMLRAPWAQGDFTTFATHTKGGSPQTITGPSGESYSQECFNLTRNVRIEGMPGQRGHIFIRGNKPHTIKYVAIRYMGPNRADAQNSLLAILGRYALHFHHCFAGTRGTVVEGVVIRNSGTRGFVPHMADGITMRDCIVYDTLGVDGDGYWWDEGQPATDLLWEHCLAAKIVGSPVNRSFRLSGYDLGGSDNNATLLPPPGRNIIRDCCSVGIIGAADSSGFKWPEFSSVDASNPDSLLGPAFFGRWNPVWTFDDNVAHNNIRHGIFTWQNDAHFTHPVNGFIAFRNTFGIRHGAYLNPYHYTDNILFSNDEYGIGLAANSGGVAAVPGQQPQGDTTQQWLRVKSDGIQIQEHRLKGKRPVMLSYCEFDFANVNEFHTPDFGWYYFVNCDLEPSDWTITVIHPSTIIKVQRTDGTAYQVLPFLDGTGASFPVISQFTPYPIFFDETPDTSGCGNPTVSHASAAQMVPTAIDSSEALGTVLITLDSSVSPTALDTSALGDPTITGDGADDPVASGNSPLILRHSTGEEAGAIFRLRRTSDGTPLRGAASAVFRHGGSATTEQNPFVLRQTDGGSRMRDEENPDIWRLRSSTEVASASGSELRTAEESVVLRGGTAPAEEEEGPAAQNVNLFEVAPDDAIGDPVVTQGAFEVVPDAIATAEALGTQAVSLNMKPTGFDPQFPDGQAGGFQSQLGPPVIDAGSGAQDISPDSIQAGQFTPGSSGDPGSNDEEPPPGNEGEAVSILVEGGAVVQRKRKGTDEYGKYGLESRSGRIPRRIRA